MTRKDIRDITKSLFESKARRNLELVEIHEDSPYVINAVVEIPKGCTAKYEYNPDLDTFQLDRCLPDSMHYPCSYGFVPSTMGEDEDPLDVLIYDSVPLDRGTIVQCNVIGALDMEDSHGQDWKILGVPVYRGKEFWSLKDIDPMFLKIADMFFKHYKDLEAQKKVTVRGWIDKKQALKIVDECCERFRPIDTLEEFLGKPIDQLG